jgi:predicted site-specific integrase-resolvase
MMSIGKAAKQLGLSIGHMRVLDREGVLVANKSPAGTRYYTQEQLEEYLRRPRKKPRRVVIGYCRVSSHKQKDDLQRQVENVSSYLTAQGSPFEIIQDIGSGINYSKPGLQQLIKRITAGEVEKIVVFYKDRLLRFGYELLEQIANLYGTSIEIIDNTPKEEQQELFEDLVQIITAFSCRLQGKRANRARKVVKELVQDLQSETKADEGAGSTTDGQC